MTSSTAAQPLPARVLYSSLAFYMRNQRLYELLWSIIGRPWRSLPLEAAYARDNVQGSEHGRLNKDFVLSDQQVDEAIPVLVQMGLYDAIDLEPGTYDVLIPGAKFGAMVRNLERIFRLMQQPGYTFRRIIIQSGQRPQSDEDDGNLADISALLGDVWDHPWVVQQMAIPTTPRNDYGFREGPFATEAELGILAAIMAAKGELVLESIVENVDPTTIPGVPVRSWQSCTFRLPNGTEVYVLNAPAIARHGNRPPRPTAASAMEYTLQHYRPEPGTTLAILPVRVHGQRVARDLAVVIGRLDPTVEVVCSCGEVVGDERRRLFNQALGEAAIAVQHAYKELEACL